MTVAPRIPAASRTLSEPLKRGTASPVAIPLADAPAPAFIGTLLNTAVVSAANEVPALQNVESSATITINAHASALSLALSLATSGAPLPAFSLNSKLGLLGTTLAENMNGAVVADANFVNGLYQNTLGRSADAAGLTAWVQLLENGFSRTAVAASFWRSPEHRALEVNQFYSNTLHRAADAGGLAFWTSALANGASELDVMCGLLTSAEYQASHNTDLDFVIGLYGDVLGRAADASGQAAGLQALASGVSRAALARSFLTSAEADRLVLDTYYSNFLGRSGDAAGEQFWVSQLQSGRVSFESVAELFLASDEYFARVNQA